MVRIGHCKICSGVDRGSYSCSAWSAEISANKWCTWGARDCMVCWVGFSGCRAALRTDHEVKMYFQTQTIICE